MKVFDHKDIKEEQLVFRNPKKIADDRWFIDVWYKTDEGPSKLLTRCPRVKVFYPAKKHFSTYSYAVSFDDIDIDDQMMSYFDFINWIDARSIDSYRKLNKVSKMITGKANFNPSVASKPEKSQLLLDVKMFQKRDEEGKLTDDLLTNVYNENGKATDYKAITYGKYVDQYLEFTGLSINSTKMTISPLWYVHQVVVSSVERIFLSKLLIDEINSDAETQTEHVHHLNNAYHHPHHPHHHNQYEPQLPTSAVPEKPKQSSVSAIRPVMVIDQSQLLQMRGKLKPLQKTEQLSTIDMLKSAKSTESAD